MKVLVSGGTGLVGRYIVQELDARGYAVTVGGRHAPPLHLFPPRVAFTPLTLDPETDQTEIFHDIDAFVHAAFSHVPGKYRGGEGTDPAGFRRLNLDGTVALFEAARHAGVRRCVFLSSRAVYGDPAGTALLRETAKTAPETLYGQVKRDAERALLSLGDADFVPTVLRATGVYGDLRPNKWDGLFADYLAGRPVPARAGTEVHGCDLAHAVRLMLTAPPDAVAGEVFNVSDIATDTRAILRPLQEATGSPHPLLPASRHTLTGEMDTAKLRALGWSGGGLPLLEETVRRLAATMPPAGAAQSSA